MNFAARVAAGIVVEVVQLPEGVEIADAFHPDAGFVAASGAVAVGMTYADGAFGPAPEPEPIGMTEAELIAYAADLRWRREIGGITVAGVPLATDDRAKLMITGARVAAMADPSWSTVWHGSDSQVYPVDAAAMITISDAVQAHVNAGFATFAAVKNAIEAGTIKTTAAIDASFSVT
jgi:hypothetical protein